MEMVLLLFTLILAKHLMLFHISNCLSDCSHRVCKVICFCGYAVFFCNRFHQTKVGSSLSNDTELISGIVQGSGIGPIIFSCI